MKPLIAIAKKTLERKTGARGLRGIMEGVLSKLMFNAPSDDTLTKVVITAACVDQTGEPEVYRGEKHHLTQQAAKNLPAAKRDSKKNRADYVKKGTSKKLFNRLACN